MNYITYVLRVMERMFEASTPTPNVQALHDMKYRAAATPGEIVTVTGNRVFLVFSKKFQNIVYLAGVVPRHPIDHQLCLVAHVT